MQKQCSRCQQFKTVDQFDIDKRWDKPRSWCRPCAVKAVIEYQKKSKKENPHHWRLKSRERYHRIKHTDQYKAKQAARQKRRRERNRPLFDTRMKVMRAKANGMLVPQPCETCGITDNIQAHHDDYSKPLKVRWLCAYHHRVFHGTQKDS